MKKKSTMNIDDKEINSAQDFITDGVNNRRWMDVLRGIIPAPKDVLVLLFILALATGTGIIFGIFEFTEANIITVYILAVLLISLFTKSYFCSVISSLLGVLLFNFFFTEPRLTFHAYEHGYPFTFVIMLIASLITGTLAGKLKNHAKQSAQAAFRTKVMFDTNQLLHQATDENEIICITATQLIKLLNRDIIAYTETNGQLNKGQVFCHGTEPDNSFLAKNEYGIAEKAFATKKRAGAGTNTLNDTKNLYLTIRTNQNVYGVIGIAINNNPIESFENNVLLSIIGECALAIENYRNAKAKEEAALLAQKEQLRANLLRAISHDLRTPLTSISGNASNLISNSVFLDEETKLQMYNDIYDDSKWLISLVENLLSVTRLEDGVLNFNMTTELIDDLIDEALKHVYYKKSEHNIIVDKSDDLLLAKMDAKLILQVIINIMDNAIKYTPDITIRTRKNNNMVSISIEDNGDGIDDETKPKVFEMFFTGNNKIVDSRRSLGLGLSLCKSIVVAHGGELVLEDNKPHGCIFTFTLPAQEDFQIE